MSNKPNPRRDDKGVPWCIRECPNCFPPGALDYDWYCHIDGRILEEKEDQDESICLRQVQLDEAELARLKGEIIELLRSAFLEIAVICVDGPHAGWFDSMARGDACGHADSLVEMGEWEIHPDGYGRRQFYRPIDKDNEKETGQ